MLQTITNTFRLSLIGIFNYFFFLSLVKDYFEKLLKNFKKRIVLLTKKKIKNIHVLVLVYEF